MSYKIWLAAIGLACGLASPLSIAEPVTKNSDTSLLEFAESVTVQHFDVVAARREAEAAVSRQNAASQPLYNPRLNFEAENGGEGDALGKEVSTLGVGISQSIDWSDKREVRALAAKSDVLSARAELTMVEQEIAAKALDALSAIVRLCAFSIWQSTESTRCGVLLIWLRSESVQVISARLILTLHASLWQRAKVLWLSRGFRVTRHCSKFASLQPARPKAGPDCLSDFHHQLK
ncbi:TolC family protein [Marinobacter sp. AC-23]|uniref:TolC family protein n=1 Tax=Marinobacter sp. AC-23 TaxID=1879031 RepID=UPI0008DE4397|nr:TolC family protein [Marinobacter sp. AC-23]OHY73509.1 hypothetical protein BCA33_18580 [Marinobacter sp. AC-23]